MSPEKKRDEKTAKRKNVDRVEREKMSPEKNAKAIWRKNSEMSGGEKTVNEKIPNFGYLSVSRILVWISVSRILVWISVSSFYELPLEINPFS